MGLQNIKIILEILGYAFSIYRILKDNKEDIKEIWNFICKGYARLMAMRKGNVSEELIEEKEKNLRKESIDKLKEIKIPELPARAINEFMVSKIKNKDKKGKISEEVFEKMLLGYGM